MGTRIPKRLKPRPKYKCDTCGGKFISIKALRSHQFVMHPKKPKRAASKPNAEVTVKRKLVPANKVLKTAPVKPKVAKKTIPEKSVCDKNLMTTPEDIKRYNTRRIEFECPVCSKIFNVYFSARKHIQKNHSINDQGEAVPPTSSDLIKPTRIELCTDCNKRVASTGPHVCLPKYPIGGVSTQTCYTCIGCEQSFPNLHYFDVHVPGLHCDEVESLFFTDKETFEAWRDNMEVQAEMKYIELSKRDSYCVYHCNHFTTDDQTAWFCPSSFTVHEFTKGTQVAFYKKHFGHEVKPYKIPEKFKKYVITSLMQNKESSYTVTNPKADPVELKQYQRLMNRIIELSENVDVEELKTLVAKALEMSKLLKKYEPEANKKKDMTKTDIDGQVTKVVDTCQKRKRVEPEVNISKRPKKNLSVQFDEDNLVGDEVQAPATNMDTKINESKEEEKKNVEQASPSSFNDSYKNFVDKISVQKMKTPRNRPEAKKKDIVKTKMGQFRPNILLSPKKGDNESTNKSTYPLPITKPDFDYEVKEQENDCNILIIKL